jgi:hypothetical protein
MKPLSKKTGLSYNDLMSKFHIHTLSSRRYGHTVTWSIILCIAVVCAASMLGRAAHNFKAALTDAPDVAIYLLLPNEHLGNTTLLRANDLDTERAYLAQTEHGPELIKLRKNKEWLIDSIESLHGDAAAATATPATETPVLH